MNPLRFATPGQLLICLVLFFLPWVEIQCPVMDLGGLADPEARAKSGGNRPLGTTPLFSQTGLQAATGKYAVVDSTTNFFLENAKEQARKEGPKGGNDVDELMREKPAPLLWLVPLAALVGVAVGCAVPFGPNRKAILILCCLLVLTAAGGQAAFGFPIEGAAQQAAREDRERRAQAGAANADRDEFEFKFKYKSPFFLTLAFAAGGLVTAAVEPLGPPRKRRRRYDEDEDEEPE